VKVAFGTDETTPVTADIQRWLSERGHDVLVVGEMLDAFLAAEPEPMSGPIERVETRD
jgi:hypothetical protein